MCERTYVLYSCNHTGRYLGRSGCDCPELVGYHCVGRNCARCAKAWREIGQLQNEEWKAGTGGDEDDGGEKGDKNAEDEENDEEEDDWDFSGDIDIDDDGDDDYGYEDDHDDEDQEGNGKCVEEADGDEEQEIQDDSDSTNSAITVLRSGKPIKSRAKILT